MASDNRKRLQQDARMQIERLKTASMIQNQAALAQRLTSGAATSEAIAVNGEQYLVFSLQERELAIKAELVQAVERLADVTLVPNLVPWIKGVMNLRGSIVSVVDLRMFLGLEPLAYAAHTRLLSLQYNEMTICFVVDGVSEMLLIANAAVAQGRSYQASIPQWIGPYASGCALLGTRLIILLDATRLLFSDKIQHYEISGLEML